ncbi:MAG: hypothetical protein F6K11_25750 [Leptolyngbya sp. SIO3F4]|nr:hypothetical protein [Leptolyngbya sp. SIO3F4]
MAAALLLPLYIRYQHRFPALKALQPNLWIFEKLTLASMVWFLAAYGFAFRLHMPGRYTSHCILLAMPILAAIAWISLLSCSLISRWREIVALIILIPLFFYYPLLLENFPKTLYVKGHEEPIYEYLKTQPKDTLVASLDYEADNIPTFAQRSILLAPEYSTPFHLNYYHQIRQRAEDLLLAHYTSDKTLLKTFNSHYSVDFWLINKAAFTPEYLANHRYWANNYQPLAQVLANRLNQGVSSVLQTKTNQCTVVQTDNFWLMAADCVLHKKPQKNSQNKSGKTA